MFAKLVKRTVSSRFLSWYGISTMHISQIIDVIVADVFICVCNVVAVNNNIAGYPLLWTVMNICNNFRCIVLKKIPDQLCWINCSFVSKAFQWYEQQLFFNSHFSSIPSFHLLTPLLLKLQFTEYECRMVS